MQLPSPLIGLFFISCKTGDLLALQTVDGDSVDVALIGVPEIYGTVTV